jgi:hypothetical protein
MGNSVNGRLGNNSNVDSGPIRTRRGQPATRHVPGAAPGGGYDMSAGLGTPEHPGGQLGLF